MVRGLIISLFLIGSLHAQILQGVMNAQSGSAFVAATPVFFSNSQEPSSEDNAVGTVSANSCVTDGFCGHFTQPTKTGNTLVVAYSYKAATLNVANVPTVTDDASNVYTCITEANDSTTSFYVGACYSLGKNGGPAGVPTVSAYAFTVTWSAAVSYPQADGWQGYAIDSFDKSAVGNGTAATTFSTAAMTGLAANDMVVHIVKVTSPLATTTTASTVGTFTVGSSFNLRAADKRDGFAVQDRVFAAGGSLTPSMTNAVSSSYATVALAFKPSALATPQGVAPSGFYVACKYSYNSQVSPNLSIAANATATLGIQLPCGTTGNELVVGMSGGSTGVGQANMIHFTSNTGSYTLGECGTYNDAAGNGFGDMWYAANITGDNSGALTMSVKGSASVTTTGDISFWSYMLAGAAPQGCTTANAHANSVFSMSSGTFPFSITTAAGGSYQPQNTSGITILAEQEASNTVISATSPCSNGFDSALQGGMLNGGPWISDENNGRAHCVTSGSTANAVQDWQITGGASATPFGGGSFSLGSFPASTAVYSANFAWAQGASTTCSTSSGSTCTSTSTDIAITTTTVNANDPLLVIVGSFNTTGRTVSKVCLDGNTSCSTGTQFTQATSAAAANAGNAMDAWYLLAGTTKASHTITAVYNLAASNTEIATWEVQNVSTFDLANHSTGTVSGGLATGPSLTTTGTTGFCTAGVGVSNSADLASGNEFTGPNVKWSTTTDNASSLVSTTAAAHQAKWADSAGTYAATTACYK